METEVVYEIENAEELQRLYQMYGWWEDRELDDIRRAVDHTDEVVSIREVKSGQLLASGRVLTDYIYSGKVLDVIVDESHRGEGLGKQVMQAITSHPKLEDVEVLTLNCRAGLVPFYENCGFRVHDMTTKRPDGTEEDYHLMLQS
ncbi:GNAT family N-acetyltransferase [Haloferax massiliensis]|uniref:GNAT family N-acetyltransferase n=1 Tax=Haloferax massiliensis TaxID=1476858 RepID=UPI000AF5493B|nr:GNAT family N-acetyltransferase [Haloferax massiliensis]